MFKRLFFFFLILASFSNNASAQLEVFFESRVGTAANTVEVDVKVNNFVDIVLFQFSINYDSTLLDYVSVSNFTTELTEPSDPSVPTFVTASVGTPIATNLGVDPGELTVSWSNISTDPDSAPDGTTLFTVVFSGVAQPCSMTNLTVSGTPLSVEVIDGPSFPTNIGVTFNPTPIQVPGTDCDGTDPMGDGCPIEGDINGVGVILPEVTAEVNTNICLPVTVDNWNDIQTSQFSISWDPTILSFTQVTNFGLNSINNASFNTAASASGNINFNYLEVPPLPVLVDGSILFEICFDVIGGDGSVTDILFGENLNVEFSNSSDQTLFFFTDCGEVVVGDTDPMDCMPDGCASSGNTSDLGIIIAEQSFDVGQSFCIPVTGDNWVDVVTAQFGLSWDPSVIMFTGIQNQNPSIPEINNGAFNLDEAANGMITFVYTDVEGGSSPANADGDVLFDLCFTVVGMPCDVTDIIIGTVTINGVPLSPEFSTLSGEVPFYTDCGEVFINNDMDPGNLTFIVDTGTASNGDTLCLNVSTRQFLNVQSAQFAITWDDSVMSYADVDCLNSQIEVLANDFMFLAPDILRFSYSPPPNTTADLNDDEVLFCVCFTAACTDDNNKTSNVDIVADGGFIIEVADGNNQTITPVDLINGAVTVTGDCVIDPSIMIEVTSNNGAPCFGELAFVNTTISPATGTSCEWLDSNNAVVSMDCDPMLPAGNYTLVVTDSNNATASTQVSITQPADIDISVSTSDVLCDVLGTATVTSTAGVTPFSYDWSIPTCTNNPTCDQLNPGAYSVTVTDADGCTDSASFVINQDAVNFTVTENITDVSCAGSGMISLLITGSNNTNTNWNPDIGNGTSVEVGDYAYTVTDMVTGCTVSSMISISSDITDLSCDGTVTNILCNGDESGSISMQIMGGCIGEEGYDIIYLPPNGSIEGNVISGLAAGEYSVTVTDDNSTTCVNTFMVTEPDAFSLLDTSITPSTGSDGAISVSVMGGTMPYSYAWIGPTIGLPDASMISDLAPGDYNLTVTDANGCMFMIADAINVPDNGTDPTLSNVEVISEADNNGFGVSCPGLTGNLCDGELNATVSGVMGNTVSITLSDDAGNDITATSFPITGLCAGNYTLTVEVGSTILSETIVITEPNPISVSSEVSNATGVNNSDGAIDLTLIGGVPDYSYDWTGPSCPCEDTADLSALLPGDYSVFITDENGCTQLAQMTVDAMVTPVICYMASPIITPNGDQVNDSFEIECAGDNDNELEVYDRWGRLVYGAVDYTGGWNGVGNDGNQLTEGAYFWVLSVTFPNSDTNLYRGTVTLLRQ